MIEVNEKIRVRPARASDARRLVSWWNDGEIMAHAGFPEGIGTNLKAVLKGLKKNVPGQEMRCMIEFEKKPVGELVYRKQGAVVDLGIKICIKSYQNKGYGKAILMGLMAYIFTSALLNDDIKVDCITLDTDLKNKRAQHVYEGLGFKKTKVVLDPFENPKALDGPGVFYEMTRAAYFEQYQGK